MIRPLFLSPILLALASTSALAQSPAPVAPAAPAAPAPETSAPAPETSAPATPAATAPATPPVAVSPDLQKLKDETARLTAEKDQLKAELDLLTATREKELAARKMALEEKKLALEEAKTAMELADTERKIALAQATADKRNAVETAMLDRTLAESKAEAFAAGVKEKDLSSRSLVMELRSGIDFQAASADARAFAQREPEYLKEPFQDNTLVISDRRIPLNGVITMNTADEITERIAFFNNKNDTQPIFIVIDDSPGGSVMAGYRILKAMEGSDAPIYVVVKSFAASMAACITTLAEKSFAYPNAVLLHHQISSGAFGNLTQQKEQVANTEEWWRRLADPVAKKLGITKEEFIKRMYAKNSNGDWEEFADEAQKLKWVDVVVEDIRETSQLVHPDTAKQKAVPVAPGTFAEAGSSPVLKESVDEKGRRRMILPRLNPRDAWWLHNPDGYYQPE